MPTLIVVTREGEERRIDSEAGRSVMEVIRNGGIDELMALCGGCCSCATCHVYVDEAWAAALPETGDYEKELLECSDHQTAASRLSCQIPFKVELDGMRVVIAPED